ncbi:hypothetical protein ILUMI_06518 [Ignelater luminosus]|uniref:Uncharacterized protein n=1 Tax=Ignelater luminosus TaxID=2038154 RepID=A0A8K0DAI7_IGNLU|nr:hypothetical protein ILUMI_06518 [Ignelater luminosus]
MKREARIRVRNYNKEKKKIGGATPPPKLSNTDFVIKDLIPSEFEDHENIFDSEIQELKLRYEEQIYMQRMKHEEEIHDLEVRYKTLEYEFWKKKLILLPEDTEVTNSKIRTEVKQEESIEV